MATVKKWPVALALLLSASASPGLAARWYLVTTGTQGPEESARNALFFVDYESLRREGARVTFWMMMVTEVPAADGMDNARVLVEADCPPRRSRYLESVMLSGDRVIGRGGALAAEQIEPGSTGAVVVAAACDGIPEWSAQVHNPYLIGQTILRERRRRATR
jgi:hypothetical protein